MTDIAPERDLMSLDEFCSRHGISRDLFYSERKKGRMPAVMHVGRRIMIAKEAAEAWRRERSGLPPAPA